MTRQVILMAPQRIGPKRKASALQSDALAQLIGDGDLIDLQDIGEPESWSHWWRNMLATTEQTVLVLVPDGSTLGFQQDQPHTSSGNSPQRRSQPTRGTPDSQTPSFPWPSKSLGWSPALIRPRWG